MGYQRWRFLRENIPNDLICSECDGVLQNPIMIKPSKQIFCKTCYENRAVIEEDENANPDQEEEQVVAVNKFLVRKINEMLMCCKYKVNGCQFVSRVDVMDTHENTCPHLSDDLINPELDEYVPQENASSRHSVQSVSARIS